MNNNDERDYEEEQANRALLADLDDVKVIEYSKDIPIATLAFTREQFDRGYAHELVRTITENEALFPGWWRETWEFDTHNNKWCVIIESKVMPYTNPIPVHYL